MVSGGCSRPGREQRRARSWRSPTGDAAGTYHVSCKGETTWAGFTARLAERLGRPARWKVVRSDELRAPAARPPNCLFRHRMLALHGFDQMPAWEAAQDEYLAEEIAR